MSEESPEYNFEQMQKLNNIQVYRNVADMHAGYYLQLIECGISQGHALQMTLNEQGCGQ
ncbi:MAG: hypothetical protein GY938_27045 [Ketobacter sp.]|nr:hypothetical protein [Ketobacter sp.]